MKIHVTRARQHAMNVNVTVDGLVIVTPEFGCKFWDRDYVIPASRYVVEPDPTFPILIAAYVVKVKESGTVDILVSATKQNETGFELEDHPEFEGLAMLYMVRVEAGATSIPSGDEFNAWQILPEGVSQ
jgi:hypothetical protein